MHFPSTLIPVVHPYHAVAQGASRARQTLRGANRSSAGLAIGLGVASHAARYEGVACGNEQKEL